MQKTIMESLHHIEQKHQVKILYACESGSRAWGFPSQNSDYDVRFLYVHPPETYLSIDPIGVGKKRDVIELPISQLLDINGWELTKALKLFRKSNPPLLEWLHSTIVYYEAYSTISQMKDISKTIFAPASCLYHYLNMARNNFRDFLQDDQVKVKKYFYVLRPVLASKWIEAHGEFPPLEFAVLLDEMMPEGLLKNEINRLLKRKMAGNELDTEPKLDLLYDFLQEEIERLTTYARSINGRIKDPTSKLDLLFRETLQEVWGSAEQSFISSRPQ